MDIRERLLDHQDTRFGRLELWEARTPDGETGYEIRLEGSFLMGSHPNHSERAMAALARQRLPKNAFGLTGLVGGLGAGHTLRALLDQPGMTRVVVAEIGESVVDWNRRYLSTFNGGAADDPRVEVVIADVLDVLASNRGAFHLVLLDVDNGPGWLAAPGNADLYTLAGLRICREALVPGGVLALWSPSRSSELESRLDATGDTRWEVVDTLAAARQAGEPPAAVYLIAAPVEREL